MNSNNKNSCKVIQLPQNKKKIQKIKKLELHENQNLIKPYDQTNLPGDDNEKITENAKILIVDDDENLCKSISMILGKKSIETCIAKTGKEAMKLANDIYFNIAILDINLPDIQGIQLIEPLKKINPEIEIIIATGYASLESAIKAMNMGAVSYISKPMKMDEVLTITSKILDKQKLVIENKKLFEEANIELNKRKKSEERFRMIAETSLDYIFQIDGDGKAIYSSPAIEQILGFTPIEIKNKEFTTIILPSEIERAKAFFNKLIMGEKIQNLEINFLHKNDKTVPLEVNIVPIIDNNNFEGLFGIARDITKRKKVETEMKRNLMKYSLEDGKLYLVDERISMLSIEAFKDILKIGYSGLIFSRIPYKKFTQHLKEDYKFFWLSECEEKFSLQPNIKEIKKKIQQLSTKYAILIDRLDYLIFKNGFDEVLSFIQHIRELAYIQGHIFIISLDTSTIDKRQLRMLQLESEEIKLKKDYKISDELLSLMRFIYKSNILGIKPSFSDICLELNLSKPTVRKRIKALVYSEHLIQVKKGNKKIVELTDRGKLIFLS